MVYTELTNKAMKIAYAAHHGQVDYNGIPYIFHPIHLAESMDDEISCCAALLHDVVEDTDYTLDDLRDMGFPSEVIDALALLTHDPAVPYMDYVLKIRDHPIARQVKLADLRHNSDPTRMDQVDEKMLEKRKTYLAAIALLEE